MFDSLATQDLIRKIQAGDQEAQDQLMERYLPQVYRLVRLKLGTGLRSKLESGDIVQEVLMNVLKGMDKFEVRSEGKLINYIGKVVVNAIRDRADFFDAQKRDKNREIPLEKKRSPGDSTPLDIPGDDRAQTPSVIAAHREERELFEQAMDALKEESEKYHSLIIAVAGEGQTYKEIAESTGKSADAVRGQFKRARTRLIKIASQIINREGKGS
jgi:RNA polymerase sigma factor (sigma-70 family)